MCPVPFVFVQEKTTEASSGSNSKRECGPESLAGGERWFSYNAFWLRAKDS